MLRMIPIRLKPNAVQEQPHISSAILLCVFTGCSLTTRLFKKKKTYKNVINSYLQWSDWCWCKGKYVMVVSRGLTSREIWWKTTREQQIFEPRCRTEERHAWVLLRSMEQWACSFSKYIIKIENIVMYLSVKVLSGGFRSSWRSIEDWGNWTGLRFSC